MFPVVLRSNKPFDFTRLFIYRPDWARKKNYAAKKSGVMKLLQNPCKYKHSLWKKFFHRKSNSGSIFLFDSRNTKMVQLLQMEQGLLKKFNVWSTNRENVSLSKIVKEARHENKFPRNTERLVFGWARKSPSLASKKTKK